MIDISSYLKKKAIDMGLCKEWSDNWGNPDKQELIDKYLKGIDFCIKHDYPNLSFIKKNFDHDLLYKNHVYIDEDVYEKDISHIAVFNGQCRGFLSFKGVSACDLYIRHKSEIRIDCTGFSKIFINLYDNAKINIRQKDLSSVYVYRHGKKNVLNSEGNVITRFI